MVIRCVPVIAYDANKMKQRRPVWTAAVIIGEGGGGCDGLWELR